VEAVLGLCREAWRAFMLRVGLESYVVEGAEGPMVGDDSAQWRRPEDMVAVLTRGGVVWSQGPPRVTHSRPCAIGSTGVTLHRWPLRSIFIPLERVRPVRRGAGGKPTRLVESQRMGARNA
jgi:hypothetical protein